MLLDRGVDHVSAERTQPLKGSLRHPTRSGGCNRPCRRRRRRSASADPVIFWSMWWSLPFPPPLGAAVLSARTTPAWVVSYHPGLPQTRGHADARASRWVGHAPTGCFARQDGQPMAFAGRWERFGWPDGTDFQLQQAIVVAKAMASAQHGVTGD